MTLLTEAEQRQVAEAIARIERGTDAELVTVLAAQADDYHYIPLLWASLIALVVPGVLLLFGDGWLDAGTLMMLQWGLFIVLALLFRIPSLTTRLVPRGVRHWRACNLARRQFVEQNLHHTDGDTGVLIFVSEAERYVEILVDRGISSRVDNQVWQGIVDTFTDHVRQGQVLEGFLVCIDACGAVLHDKVPATHARDELPNRLVVLD